MSGGTAMSGDHFLRVTETMEYDSVDNQFVQTVASLRDTISSFYKKYHHCLWNTFYITLALLYAAYFICAMNYEFGSEASVRLLWITCLVVVGVLMHGVHQTYGEKFEKKCKPLKAAVSPHAHVISR